MSLNKDSILIFTDGACTGNPGPGGWGSIVSFPDGQIRELGGGDRQTTNNKMEITAAIRALAAVESASEIILYTDSTYVIKGITQWIWGWRSRGWKNAEGKDVANRELWEELSRQIMRLKPATIHWKYVRGHAGYPGNERCDEIAVGYSKNDHTGLYVGPRDGYFVDLSQLPPDEGIPEQKKSDSGSKSSSGKSGSSASKGGGPASYLSYYGGVVMRHSTWADCERRVKGQSNAKFKKTKSQQEETETLRAWGLDAKTSITEG